MRTPRHFEEIVTFLVGAAILILETEFRVRDVRPLVIGLALVLMGILPVELIVERFRHQTPPPPPPAPPPPEPPRYPPEAS